MAGGVRGMPAAVDARQEAQDGTLAGAEACPETPRLVRLARNGDKDAFACLVDLYQQSAWRVAMAALGRADEAEDAAQDGFLSAWSNLSRLREDDRFRPWLLSIVWRKALDRRRGRRSWLRMIVAPRGAGADEPVWSLENSPDLCPTPEDETISRSAAMAARKVIAGLPRKLRDPLLLAASGDYRYDEIAIMLDIPLGTVKWRVSEARKIVKAKLARLERSEPLEERSEPSKERNES